MISGLYLTPVSTTFRATCHAEAHAATFPIPCPGLLPAHALWTCPCAGEYGFLLHVFAPAPTSYSGDGPGSLHLVVGASPDPASPWVSCSGAEAAGTVVLAGITRQLLRCPPASEANGGHLLLRWQTDEVTYTVSLHGWTNINRKLLLLIATHITLVASTPLR